MGVLGTSRNQRPEIQQVKQASVNVASQSLPLKHVVSAQPESSASNKKQLMSDMSASYFEALHTEL